MSSSNNIIAVSSVPSVFQNQYQLTTYPNGRPLRGSGVRLLSYMYFLTKSNNYYIDFDAVKDHLASQ